MLNDAVLTELQTWFLRNCNGDWEHGCGIQIATLDNPGWSLTIDLVGTPLAGMSFEELRVDLSDNDWYWCRVENDTFKGWCGVHNLAQVIGAFVAWDQTSTGLG